MINGLWELWKAKKTNILCRFVTFDCPDKRHRRKMNCLDFPKLLAVVRATTWKFGSHDQTWIPRPCLLTCCHHNLLSLSDSSKALHIKLYRVATVLLPLVQYWYQHNIYCWWVLHAAVRTLGFGVCILVNLCCSLLVPVSWLSPVCVYPHLYCCSWLDPVLSLHVALAVLECFLDFCLH